MKTEIPDLGKVQYYYTDLLFLLSEGCKLNIFFTNTRSPFVFRRILSIKYLELFS